MYVDLSKECDTIILLSMNIAVTMVNNYPRNHNNFVVMTYGN